MTEIAKSASLPLAMEKFLPMEKTSLGRRFWLANRTMILVFSGLVFFFIFWEIEATTLKWVEPYFIPPISKIMRAAWVNIVSGEIPMELVWSLQNFVVGYSIAAAIAIPLGLAMGSFPVVNRLLSPYVWIMYSMPRIAFLPIVIIALGFGRGPKVLFIALASFFQIVIPTIAGVLTVSPSLLKVGRLFGGSRLQVYRKIVLPYAMNFIVTGMRLAARTGMMVMYSTEMYGSPRGIASYVVKQAEFFHFDGAFAGLLVLIVLALTLTSVIDIADTRLRPWKGAVAF